MDLLSSKNHYERDERIQFSDSDHTYLIDKKNKAVSVTEIDHQQSEPLDNQAILH